MLLPHPGWSSPIPLSQANGEAVPVGSPIPSEPQPVVSAVITMVPPKLWGLLACDVSGVLGTCLPLSIRPINQRAGLSQAFLGKRGPRTPPFPPLTPTQNRVSQACMPVGSPVSLGGSLTPQPWPPHLRPGSLILVGSAQPSLLPDKSSDSTGPRVASALAWARHCAAFFLPPPTCPASPAGRQFPDGRGCGQHTTGPPGPSIE